MLRRYENKAKQVVTVRNTNRGTQLRIAISHRNDLLRECVKRWGAGTLVPDGKDRYEWR